MKNPWKVLGLYCLIRFIYYWFRYPFGYYISGHEFEIIDDTKPITFLRCKDCGYMSL